MNKHILYIFVLLSAISLNACDNDDERADVEDDDDDQETVSLFLQIAELTADSEPSELDNEELEEDITDIFGDEDSATTDVLLNDTVRDVVDRATED